MNIFIVNNKISLLLSLAIIAKRNLKQCVFIDTNDNISEKELDLSQVSVYRSYRLANNWGFRNRVKGWLFLIQIIALQLVKTKSTVWFNLYLTNSSRYLHWLFAHCWFCKSIYGLEEGLSAYNCGILDQISPIKNRFPHKFEHFFCISDSSSTNVGSFRIKNEIVEINESIIAFWKQFFKYDEYSLNEFQNAEVLICPSDPFHKEFPVSLESQLKVFLEVLNHLNLEKAHLIPKRTKYGNINNTINEAQRVIDNLNISSRIVIVEENTPAEILLYGNKKITLLSEYSSLLIYAKLSGNKAISYMPFFKNYPDIYVSPEKTWSSITDHSLLPDILFPNPSR